MGTIFIVGADKGGTGKTTLARALGEYFDGKGIARDDFDTEHPKGGLKRFNPLAEIVNIESTEGQMRVFDGMNGNILIDVRAGMLSPVLQMLDEVRLLDDVKNGIANLAVLHVLGPTKQSLGEVFDVVKAIGPVHHFPIRNYVSSTADYLQWAEDPEISLVLDKLKAITVPHLDDKAAGVIDRDAWSFSGYAASSESRVLTGKVHTWLRAVWKEFDRVGIADLAVGRGT